MCSLYKLIFCSYPNPLRSLLPTLSVQYVNEFNAMDVAPRPPRREKHQGGRKEPDIQPGPPFEPSYVYKMLNVLTGDTFSEGHQQDAEEMLSALLNGLHDEMVEALKLAGAGPAAAAVDNASDEESEQADEEDEWQVRAWGGVGGIGINAMISILSVTISI